MPDIVLASKSKVRKTILEKNEISCTVKPSNVDEEPVKMSLLKEGASPEIISKKVDLPLPESPIIPIKSPFEISKFMFFNMSKESSV